MKGLQGRKVGKEDLQVPAIDAGGFRLAHYPLKRYRHLRRQNHTPRAHWWWYLDEVDAAALAALNERSGTQPRAIRVISG